ncbi:hypothetical protein T05_7113 [Trichinella murrelli]|uniref:Uncharacterized protein n=1 Tax=Trichinella murrelli TaxID=144512 RepID=A0A0V0T4E7_9BILA|nr:hypothetical protein T05_11016 [Trichinella murrelli]KRX33898.1 hypothetical protein T05_7113 [Trichinella murrelli]
MSSSPSDPKQTRPFEQKMADLPKMRKSETFPFENNGLDFIGPLHIDRDDGGTIHTSVEPIPFTTMTSKNNTIRQFFDFQDGGSSIEELICKTILS